MDLPIRVVNNFTNHLYALAADFCKNEKINFDVLKPLINETVERINHNSPADIQTGPAVRNDVQTIDRHLQLLNEYPELKSIYLKLTNSIINSSGKE